MSRSYYTRQKKKKNLFLLAIISFFSNFAAKLIYK